MDFKNFIVICLLIYSFLFTATAVALTCPSIGSVNRQQEMWPNGRWLPLYIKNGELASMEDIHSFSEAVTALKQVEWNASFPEAGHCYYAGDNRIVLARDALKPDALSYPTWSYTIPGKVAHCVSTNESKCPFSGEG